MHDADEAAQIYTPFEKGPAAWGSKGGRSRSKSPDSRGRPASKRVRCPNKLRIAPQAGIAFYCRTRPASTAFSKSKWIDFTAHLLVVRCISAILSATEFVLQLQSGLGRVPWNESALFQFPTS